MTSSPSSIMGRIASAKEVLILGFAREGQSTYNFLRSRFPDLHIALADQKTPDWIPDHPHTETFFGDSYLDSLSGNRFPIVIKTPGISPHKPEIAAARNSGVLFTSQTQLFFEVCPGRIIGVTGTKGKSTTSSLLYHVLHTNGLPTVLVGNIGEMALNYLDKITPSTWVVMELSSYQLMDLTRSPHIAVLQNIVPDHLDYHTDFAEYVSAKQNIARFQTADDYFLYNADYPLPQETSRLTPAQKIPYSLSNFDPAIKSNLLGDHNKYNILPSVIIGPLLNIPVQKVYESIATFTPLDTRLQLVGTVNGIDFYEDTLATIPEATMAAIDALHPRVSTLIAGGHERKQNYSELAKKILDTGIKNLVVFPDTGPRIWEEITRLNPTPPVTYHYTESMSDAVSFALDHTASGEICLLSPAAPSFTLFKDYRDEGQQYRFCINQPHPPSSA